MSYLSNGSTSCSDVLDSEDIRPLMLTPPQVEFLFKCCDRVCYIHPVLAPEVELVQTSIFDEISAAPNKDHTRPMIFGLTGGQVALIYFIVIEALQGV